MHWVALIGACAAGPTGSTPMKDDTARNAAPSEPIDTAEAQPADPPVFITGAFVTEDCTYEGYPYAIDILLSCGDERFGAELRLHTFKRHAYAHRTVFADQRITLRDGQLWFDGYSPPRCVRIDSSQRLMLESSASRCSTLALHPVGSVYRLTEPASGLCAGLGVAQCDDHAFTGGRECGGIDHRYLPLRFGSCDSALGFRVATQADECPAEFPAAECF